MAGQPAAAPTAAGFHDGVADLARVPGVTPAQLVAQDEATAHAGADPHAEHVGSSPAGTAQVLGEGADVGVVVDVDGDAAQGLGQHGAQGDIVLLPSRQVGGLAHDARLVVDGAGCPDADALDPVGATQVLDHGDDGVHHRGRAPGERSLALGVGPDLLALLDDPVDLGPPEVDPDPGHIPILT